MNLLVSACKASPANRIYILDVLKVDELQTGLRKYDQIRDEVLKKMPEQAEFIRHKIFHKKCHDLNSLKEVLMGIKEECDASTFPLIFIDGHGDKLQGLQVSSGEFLGWGSFNRYLEEITCAAHGNLTVVASFCHSMSALKRPDFGKPLPCPFYYGYADEVFAGDVEAESKGIIEELFQQGWLDERGKKIELYSEYTHVQLFIVPLIMMFIEPQRNVKKFPLLSKNKLKEKLRCEAAKLGRAKGFNAHFSNVMNLPSLVEHFICISMHKTERRDKLIAEIVSQLKKNIEAV
jgi:hypothetical protein